MASIGDFGVKKLPHFYELWPACVNLVTMKSLNAVYYESTLSENFFIYNFNIVNNNKKQM